MARLRAPKRDDEDSRVAGENGAAVKLYGKLLVAISDASSFASPPACRRLSA